MDNTVSIKLELEMTDPVSGMIGAPDGTQRPFSGWLDMHASIERICTQMQTRLDRTDPACEEIPDQPG